MSKRKIPSLDEVVEFLNKEVENRTSTLRNILDRFFGEDVDISDVIRNKLELELEMLYYGDINSGLVLANDVMSKGGERSAHDIWQLRIALSSCNRMENAILSHVLGLYEKKNT